MTVRTSAPVMSMTIESVPLSRKTVNGALVEVSIRTWRSVPLPQARGSILEVGPLSLAAAPTVIKAKAIATMTLMTESRS